MYDIYSNAKNDAWRFALGKSGQRPLFTVALNPSTATREKSDPTAARVEEVARRNGFDGFVLFNLYPVRATDYRALSPKVNAAAYRANLAAIEQLLERQMQPTLWAAWGACVAHRKYFEQARDELVWRLHKYGPIWVRFGELTQSGHPRHPSRLDYSWQFQPYAVGSGSRTAAFHSDRGIEDAALEFRDQVSRRGMLHGPYKDQGPLGEVHV